MLFQRLDKRGARGALALPRILGTLRKVNVPGLEAVDSFIDFGINAHNIYTDVTNKFDEINSVIQNDLTAL